MLENEVLETMTLDDIIVYLLDLKKQGISVTHKIGNCTLSSDTITWDSAYMDFYGMTKQDYDATFAANLISNRCKYTAEQVQTMYERGLKIIPKKKHDEWKECVIGRTSGTVYGGDDLAVALNLMEVLANNENNVLDAVQLYMDIPVNGGFNDGIRNIVFRFSNLGPDFYTKSTRSPLTAEQVINIEKQRQENLVTLSKNVV